MSTIRDEFKLDVPKKSLQCHPVWLSEQENRAVSVAHSTEVCLHLDCSSEEQSRTANQSKEHKMYGTGSRTA